MKQSELRVEKVNYEHLGRVLHARELYMDSVNAKSITAVRKMSPQDVATKDKNK